MNENLLAVAASAAMSFGVTGLVSSATPAAAYTVPQCEHLSILAEEVMLARQEGVPLQDVVAEVQDQAGGPVAEAISLSVVKGAYEEPRWSDSAKQAQAVERYTNVVFFACLRAEGD